MKSRIRSILFMLTISLMAGNALAQHQSPPAKTMQGMVQDMDNKRLPPQQSFQQQSFQQQPFQQQPCSKTTNQSTQDMDQKKKKNC